MLDLINVERANAGLNPLKLNTLLNQSSEDHSTWMINTDTFSHTGQGDHRPRIVCRPQTIRLKARGRLARTSPGSPNVAQMGLRMM
ncbi:CAP domain-containing protein [Fontisubflavum oceani]|nr:CAP domain-containing protein [Fontisubflavum oceani]WJY21345.1 CAP domain-containing protein [Fontisubflavum oceani]